ncbi:hypothetical protein QR680_007461 [Steinernema hermaphroditum]|uniref:HORMA domain-containing protein n=1 Tax=Steinernema hermaphroditum TaxID=289476 RepID=A0AA39IFP9_9BILA|nr:hypothetical protein QR680_007461 [Steinernema hermaphroditum]
MPRGKGRGRGRGWGRPRARKQVERNEDDIDIGKLPRDHTKEFAKIVCAFLRDLSHTFVYKYGGYEPDEFHEETAFKEHTVMVCEDEELIEYIETTLRSVNRWLEYQKLEGFAVALVNNNETVAYSYQINFFKPEVKVKKKIADFLVYITDLRKKFFEILNKIRYSKRPADADDRSLHFRILCKLIPETTIAHRPSEYAWEKVENMTETSDSLLLPLGTRIDNPIVQADMYGKHCKATKEEEAEYSEDDSD